MVKLHSVLSIKNVFIEVVQSLATLDCFTTTHFGVFFFKIVENI